MFQAEATATKITVCTAMLDTVALVKTSGKITAMIRQSPRAPNLARFHCRSRPRWPPPPRSAGRVWFHAGDHCALAACRPKIPLGLNNSTRISAR